MLVVSFIWVSCFLFLKRAFFKDGGCGWTWGSLGVRLFFVIGGFIISIIFCVVVGWGIGFGVLRLVFLGWVDLVLSICVGFSRTVLGGYFFVRVGILGEFCLDFCSYVF